MTKEGDIPTIFNPRRGRAPSVVVTDEGVAANGPFTHTDSVGSNQQETGEQVASPTGQTTTTTGVRGRLKSCSSSLCSQSARKVRSVLFFATGCCFYYFFAEGSKSTLLNSLYSFKGLPIKTRFYRQIFERPLHAETTLSTSESQHA